MKTVQSFCLLVAVAVPGLALADGVAILQNVGNPPTLQYYGFPGSAFFTPDNAASGGGARVAVGDVDGDGVDDIVTAPIAGTTKVFMYSGVNFATKTSFPIASAIVNPSVAVAPIQPGRDGRVIIGYGPTNSPIINVFNATSGIAMATFFAFDPSFKGGVHVAAGDVNGDGIADIVAGHGTGGPVVKIFDGKDFTLINSFDAYSGGFTGGVTVAAGDVNGDHVCEVIAGPTTGAQPIRVFNPITGALVQSFFPFDPSFTGGVNVAASDHDRDGYDDIVMSVRGNGTPTVRVYSPKETVDLANFLADAPTYTGGTCVGGSIHRTPRTTFRIPTADIYYRGPVTQDTVDIQVFHPSGTLVSHQTKNLLGDGTVEFDCDFRGNCKARIKRRGCLSRVVNATASGRILTLPPISSLPGDCNGDN